MSDKDHSVFCMCRECENVLPPLQPIAKARLRKWAESDEETPLPTAEELAAVPMYHEPPIGEELQHKRDEIDCRMRALTAQLYAMRRCSNCDSEIARCMSTVRPGVRRVTSKYDDCMADNHKHWRGEKLLQENVKDVKR